MRDPGRAGIGMTSARTRERLVARLAEQGISDPDVLEQIRKVPRHLFVDEALATRAYEDTALPIGHGQTISQPYVVARMSELLEVAAEHKVLEIGTGSGYQTAILARLARWVYSLERIPELAHQAIHRIRQLGIPNVKIQAFDGTIGWSDVAPFDRILVTAGAPSVPRPLLDQLASGGRLVIPEGDRQRQRLVLYERIGSRTRRKELDEVAFVPLIGRFGWEAVEGEPR
jgi:protein-L-isoaspartate(D-aspartate) O-methyltransferase